MSWKMSSAQVACLFVPTAVLASYDAPWYAMGLAMGAIIIFGALCMHEGFSNAEKICTDFLEKTRDPD